MNKALLPIPYSALDDRLAFVGTSGSGKTYAAGTAVELLLQDKKRVVIIDPLGVWWGLRLLADGVTPSRWPVVIFGGPHGDLPINDRAGALIGETVAGMSESCIVALDGLGSKSAERKFMLGFLETLYRKVTGEPFHFVVDEADLLAPQKTTEPMLQSMMENIVRRGRIKGFIPWLLTQRPAVISKDVLSQADGLVAMKLTASQDRDALGAWIEGQADRAEEKRILGALPTMSTGEGYIWIPGRNVLEFGAFPQKVTFDSSRTPRRGEKRVSRDVKPLDVEKLRGKLAKVEQEAAENDPAKLRMKVRELEATIRRASSNAPASPAPDPAALAKAERRGYEAGYRQGAADEWAKGASAVRAEVQVIGDDTVRLAGDMKATGARLWALVKAIDQMSKAAGKSVPPPASQPTVAERPAAPTGQERAPVGMPAPSTPAEGFSMPQTKILRALAMWKSLGNNAPTKAMIAFVSGYSPTSSTFTNILGALRSAGAIEYPASGCAALRVDGFDMPHDEARATFHANLTGPQKKVIEALSHGELDKPELARRTGYSPTSSTYTNILGAMRTLGLLDYPSPGKVELKGWVYELL